MSLNNLPPNITELNCSNCALTNIDNFPDLLGNYKKEKDDIHIETATNYMEQIKKAKLVINNNANIDNSV